MKKLVALIIFACALSIASAGALANFSVSFAQEGPDEPKPKPKPAPTPKPEPTPESLGE